MHNAGREARPGRDKWIQSVLYQEFVVLIWTCLAVASMTDWAARATTRRIKWTRTNNFLLIGSFCLLEVDCDTQHQTRHVHVVNKLGV
jgi:hypothetical protein